jgi:hypothetical protein
VLVLLKVNVLIEAGVCLNFYEGFSVYKRLVNVIFGDVKLPRPNLSDFVFFAVVLRPSPEPVLGIIVYYGFNSNFISFWL